MQSDTIFSSAQSSRTSLVLGSSALFTLANARVVVFGLGGVGSYTVETLARAGVGALDIIDADVIEESNINRQLYALHSTIGQPKVEAARERILDINPFAQVRAIREFYLPENGNKKSMASSCIAGASFVIDAVDTVAAKAGIITSSIAARVPVISCMGMGNKIDPSLLKIADISETSVCPLARAVRHALKERGIERSVKVVFSTEKPITRGQVIGSVPFVPGVAGMMMAGEVIREIAAC